MKANVLFAISVAGGLIAACAPSPTPVGQVTSPSPSAIASAAPAPGACDASHRCLALVTLRGSDNIVVRDITDINHPTTISKVGLAAFVSATELSYEDSTTLYRMPLSGSPKTVVAKATKGIGLFAWTADGRTAGYMTADGLHVISEGRDRTFGEPLPVPAGGYGCEGQVECVDGWDSRLAFSSDGAYISLVVVSGPVTGFRLWSSDGKLLTIPPLQGQTIQGGTMSVWSGRTLYFRDSSGVEAWTDGVTSRFLQGVQWVRPKASPAGGAIVYEARDRSGLAHVYLVNTATKKITELKAARSEPAFLTSRYVWYAGERLCLPTDQCAMTSTLPTGKTYIYDLQTGTEYTSIITSVIDVWPHAA